MSRTGFAASGRVSRAGLSWGGVSPDAQGFIAAPSVLRQQELPAQSRENTGAASHPRNPDILHPAEQPLSGSPVLGCASLLPALPAQRLDPAAHWSCLQIFLDALPSQACAAWS